MMHTPGPWEIIGIHVYQVDEVGGRGVLHGASVKGEAEERDANLRLISAAPELLEIAERYRETLDGEQCTCHLCVSHCPACCEKELVEQAIAKAKGVDDDCQ